LLILTGGERVYDVNNCIIPIVGNVFGAFNDSSTSETVACELMPVRVQALTSEIFSSVVLGISTELLAIRFLAGQRIFTRRQIISIGCLSVSSFITFMVNVVLSDLISPVDDPYKTSRQVASLISGITGVGVGTLVTAFFFTDFRIPGLERAPLLENVENIQNVENFENIENEHYTIISA